MKKGMLVVTMFAALSFLVSAIAVAPAVAKQVTKTEPTSKQQTQQGTVQTSVAKQLPKDKFWDLAVDYCTINGLSVPNTFMPPDNCCTTTVKVGQTATITCYYSVKTPTVSSITEADVSAWGTGKSYKVKFFYPNAYTMAKEENKALPQFTWVEVQMWKQGGQGNAPRIWSLSAGFTLTLVQADVNSIKELLFKFVVDGDNAIKEPNEVNNLFFGWFKVTP